MTEALAASATLEGLGRFCRQAFAIFRRERMAATMTH